MIISTHQSPSSEHDSSSDSQKKSPIFYGKRNLDFMFERSPLDPNLNHMNPVLILSPSFFKIHFNIISHLSLSPKWCFSFRFSAKILYQSHIPKVSYMSRPSHPWFDHRNSIWWSV